MQKITPNLWCDGNARQIADFYSSIFTDAAVTGGSKYPDSQADGLADFQLELAGKDLTIELRLAGQDFVLINAEPDFKPTAANSFFINFDPSRDDHAKASLQQLWDKLADGGIVRLPLQKYPFSEYYGWVEDKFGFSWQLILTNPDGEDRPVIVPSLLFAGAHQNQAKAALEYYASVFDGARLGNIAPYPVDTGPAKADESLAYGDVELAPGEWLAAMDSGVEQNVTFNEAVSYSVVCKDQAEIDYFWNKLSSVPESEQCGWCKDRFGVSWQIVPENMGQLMAKPDSFKALMRQHKIVIAEH